MSTAGHSNKLLEQQSKNKNAALEEPVLTPKQQQKQDALDLAEHIYAIYNSTCPISLLDEKKKGKNYV